MTKQRILHVTTAHQPRDVRIYHKEVVGLLSHGYRVVLATATDRALTEDAVEFVPLGATGGSRWRRVPRNFRALAAMLNGKNTLVHIHDPELLITSIVPLLLGQRIVYDVHEFYYERLLQSEWVPKPARRFVAELYAFLERTVIPSLAGLVVVTPDMYERYKKLFPACRLALVRNLPQISAREIDRARARPRPIEERYVLHTGGASVTKAFETLVSMAEFLASTRNDVTIVNFGPQDLSGYPSKQRQSLLARARAANMQLRGLIPYGELLPWIAHAEIGYIGQADTDNERLGLSTKFFEYLCFGKTRRGVRGGSDRSPCQQNWNRYCC